VSAKDRKVSCLPGDGMGGLSRRGELFTGIVLEVFRLNRLLLDAGDQLSAPAGLTSARWQVLGVVEHGPAHAAEIGRAMGLTRQSVQEVANGLEAEGFIEFAPNPQHRRAKLLVMMAKGDAAIDVVRWRHAAWANGLGGSHSTGALKSVMTVLAEIRTALEERRVRASSRGSQVRLNHVNLTVTDVPGAARFLETYFRLEARGGNAGMAFLTDDDGFVLTLMKARGADPPAYPSTFHIGFFIDGEDRVDDINQRLREDGFEVAPPTRSHAYGFYVEAPGGFTVELGA
jgi:DNA-binding MarR family transcriptional regulator/catechol 2,3-dioxygenase-like lactoylglutathione lyase family enzyme